MKRSRTVEVSVEVRGETWIVAGVCVPGSPDTYDRGFGMWVPGDAPTVEDIEIKEEGTGKKIMLSDITSQELTKIEDALLDAADDC